MEPGGALSPTSASGTGNSAPASNSSAGGHSRPALRLYTVTAPDSSATIGIPDGWRLDPHSGHGAMLVTGPHGEEVFLGMSRPAIYPTRQGSRMPPPPPGVVVYPFRGDTGKEFPNLFQAWRRAGGLPPAPLQVEQIIPMQGPQNFHCTIVNGQLDSDEKGPAKFSDNMCASDPGPGGTYLVTLNHMMAPNALAEQEHDLLGAILASWKANMQVVNQQNDASNQDAIRMGKEAIDRIHAIGADATARYNATQAANESQHAGYWAQQDTNARNGQGFSNYLLDQTVIQGNDRYDNRAVGHATVWSTTADALAEAYPNRFEIVDTPNYWRGIDY